MPLGPATAGTGLSSTASHVCPPVSRWEGRQLTADWGFRVDLLVIKYGNGQFPKHGVFNGRFSITHVWGTPMFGELSIAIFHYPPNLPCFKPHQQICKRHQTAKPCAQDFFCFVLRLATKKVQRLKEFFSRHMDPQVNPTLFSQKTQRFLMRWCSIDKPGDFHGAFLVAGRIQRGFHMFSWAPAIVDVGGQTLKPLASTGPLFPPYGLLRAIPGKLFSATRGTPVGICLVSSWYNVVHHKSICRKNFQPLFHLFLGLLMSGMFQLFRLVKEFLSFYPDMY